MSGEMVRYKRPRLGPRVWGLSGSWFAVCPWNGDTAWITLPFIYFGIGTKNIRARPGKGQVVRRLRYPVAVGLMRRRLVIAALVFVGAFVAVLAFLGVRAFAREVLP